MTDTTTDTETRYENADIPTLRRVLMENADRYQQHATSLYPTTKLEAGDPSFLAWSTLAVSSAHCLLLAGLLGVIDRDAGTADGRRAEARALIGPFLDGWAEVVEAANDDLYRGAESAPSDATP